MHVLSRQFRFEAAHRLPNHPGKCKRIHGHSWVGYVVVEGETLHKDGPEAGMVIDFGLLKDIVQQMCDRHLDHFCLNESLDMEHPTSENVARWVADYLRQRLHVRVRHVIIEETRHSRCVYEPPR